MLKVLLPEGWKWLPLQNLAKVCSEKYQPNGSTEYYVGLEHIEKGTGKIADTAKKEAITTIKGKLKTGDILYGKLRPYLNKVTIAHRDGVCSTDILVLRSTNVAEPKYLHYFMLSSQFVSNTSANTAGVNLPRVATKYIENYLVPTPSIRIQRQIVARIEELFSEVDAGVKELQTALQQLKTYRQAVMNYYLSDEEWKTVKIDSLLSDSKKGMKTGPFGMAMGKADHKKSGVPVLGIENIGRGKFIDGNKIFITEEKAQELAAYQVEGNDLIISRSGTVGEICIVPERMKGSILSTNLMKVSLNRHEIIPQFFCYLFLGCKKILDDVKEQCKGSTRDFLNQGILKSLDIPLPDIKTQASVVAEIETKLSEADAMETTIRESLIKAEALRQSILKRAFEGRLVSGSPDDLSEDLTGLAVPTMAKTGQAEQMSLFN